MIGKSSLIEHPGSWNQNTILLGGVNARTGYPVMVVVAVKAIAQKQVEATMRIN